MIAVDPGVEATGDPPFGIGNGVDGLGTDSVEDDEGFVVSVMAVTRIILNAAGLKLVTTGTGFRRRIPRLLLRFFRR